MLKRHGVGEGEGELGRILLLLCCQDSVTVATHLDLSRSSLEPNGLRPASNQYYSGEPPYNTSV